MGVAEFFEGLGELQHSLKALGSHMRNPHWGQLEEIMKRKKVLAGSTWLADGLAKARQGRKGCSLAPKSPE